MGKGDRPRPIRDRERYNRNWERIFGEDEMADEINCPECGRVWERETEQAISIELFGFCIACGHIGMTQGMLDRIAEESTRQEYDNHD